MTPGIHDLGLAAYLRDPAPEPSLSAGIAQTLLNRSPWHAWWRHPRYGGQDQDYRRDAALGSVVHAMILGSEVDYEVLDAPDFRTKAAREARDRALEAGMTPITLADYGTAQAIADAAGKLLAAHEVGDFRERGGDGEQTVLWQEGETWCRACVDWLPDDPDAEGAVYDIKTTANAHPDVWTRRIYEQGYDLSAAHYLRGLRQTLGLELAYRFVVIETKEPFALTVVELSGAALAMAERKRKAAVNLFAKCQRRGVWPAYPTGIVVVTPPPWAEARQIETEQEGRWDPALLEAAMEVSAP